MLILTWHIYYFHRTQRLPQHFTKGDDFCGMGGEKTTAAQGAHGGSLWTGALTQGGVGKLEEHPPRRYCRSVNAKADPKPSIP